MPDFSKAAMEALVANSLRERPAEIVAPAQTPEQRGVSKWAQLATALGHGIDAGGTVYALNNGAEESNPLYGKQPSTGRVLGTKAGLAGLQMLIQHFIGKKSPTTANVMGYGTGALTGGMGVANVLARKGKK